MLKKLATIVYSLCFKKQTLELLLHLSFKAELPTKWPLRYFFLGLKIYSDVKKLLRGHRAILSYLGPKFLKFSHDKATFFYIV